jgi:para-nitrobenzyl esterase
MAGAACAAVLAVTAIASPAQPPISPAIAKAGLVSSPSPHAEPRAHAAAAAGCVTLPNKNQLCGVQSSSQNVTAFWGIPYAYVPPTRWQPSSLITNPAGGTAAQPGKMCPQAPYNPATMDENCLSLNIWSVLNSSTFGNMSVLVFIHGGAFVSGSGSDALYDGSRLATGGSGVVVVTLNYRLGALGFLTSTDQGVTSLGNLGLADQQNALLWVKANIRAFGGDPNRVTIVGESAGAMSVGLHTFSVPSSKGLFSKAIMESNPMGEYYLTNTNATTVGNHFIDYLCSNPTGSGNNSGATCTGNWTIGISTSAIVAAQTNFLTSDGSDIKSGYIGIRSLPWQPHLGGANMPITVTAQPYLGFQPGTDSTVPVGIGINQDEGVLFAADLAIVESLINGKSVKEEPSTPTYTAMIPDDFPSGDTSAILGAYPVAGSGQNYYSAAGVAFSNLVNDFMFGCGGEQIASTVTQNGGTVYFYYFTQPPFFDLYNKTDAPPSDFNDNGACAPGQDHVCHGSELPYVFNNFTSIENNSNGKYQPQDSDRGLATKMSTAWSNFATVPNNGTPLPAPWVKYSASTTQAFVLNGSSSGSVDIDTTRHCTANWFDLPVPLFTP